MAKWRRGGGGRRRGRWVIEYVPLPEPLTPKVIDMADPYTFDTPEAIRAALWRFEQRKMLEEKLGQNGFSARHSNNMQI